MQDALHTFSGAWSALDGWLGALIGDPLLGRAAVGLAFVLAMVLAVRSAWPNRGLDNRFAERTSQHAALPVDEEEDVELTTIGTIANQIFLQFETIAYIALGLLLAATIVLGISGTGAAVWNAAISHSGEETLVYTVDRMLFVLMVVEILRTVRDSFRSGRLVSEPFLIVGLIASIRRVLVITLESAQVSRTGVWSPASQNVFNASMIELVVLGVLILIMVLAIFLLRYSRRYKHTK